MEFPTTAAELFIAGYVIFCMGMNAISFLISAFFRKKTANNAPSLGFLLSLLLGAAFVGTFLIQDTSDYMNIVRTTTLLGCSMSSTLSMAGLLMSMRRRRAR